jgi:hypothetical protein
MMYSEKEIHMSHLYCVSGYWTIYRTTCANYVKLCNSIEVQLNAEQVRHAPHTGVVPGLKVSKSQHMAFRNGHVETAMCIYSKGMEV